MSDANRLQTSVWLGDLYENLLTSTALARNSDTASLHALATKGLVQTAHDALQYNLVDGLKYDDEIKTILHNLLHTTQQDDINFITPAKYAQAVHYKQNGSDRIALIYAQGDIVEGKANQGQIGDEEYIKLLRRARMDNDVKAIVVRVNSPGGSAVASDNIWREISMAKKIKPVVVSMGDYAASGGYYISCEADSIFADAGTITGSIGVFSMLVNMQPFFKDKLGITFDGVKTAPYADMGSISRPLSEVEKKFFQNDVDTIYSTFKHRVATARHKDESYIDSIAQGRVWTGTRGVQIGIADKIGSLQDAIDCAARMAKTKDYYVKEYPEKKNPLEQFLNNSWEKASLSSSIKNELGNEQYKLFTEAAKLQKMANSPQARLPFDFDIK